MRRLAMTTASNVANIKKMSKKITKGALSIVDTLALE
jgi:hypothetical protein